MHGRHIAGKALVVVAAEEDGRGMGRIRLRHIPDASAASLIPFIEDSIESGGTVHTATCRCARPLINTVSAIKKAIRSGLPSCRHALSRSFRY